MKIILLKNIIDVARLQRIMDKFHRISKIPASIVDGNGEILVASGWQEACSRFHRLNPASAKRCFDSDEYFHEHLSLNDCIKYKCRNGFWHIGIPIIVENKKLASIFVSQFFYDDEEIDSSFFKKQGVEIGVELEPYLKSIEKIREFTREEVDNIMSFYADFATFISEQACHNLRLKKNVDRLEGLLPICANCKKIRDDRGYWNQIETYISERSGAKFSHGLCENCSDKLYGNKKWYQKKKLKSK